MTRDAERLRFAMSLLDGAEAVYRIGDLAAVIEVTTHAVAAAALADPHTAWPELADARRARDRLQQAASLVDSHEIAQRRFDAFMALAWLRWRVLGTLADLDVTNALEPQFGPVQ